MVRAHRRIQDKEKCCKFVHFRGTVSFRFSATVWWCLLCVAGRFLEKAVTHVTCISLCCWEELCSSLEEIHIMTPLLAMEPSASLLTSSPMTLVVVLLYCMFDIHYIKMSVIFIKWFCKTFLMLTKAAFIWSIYSKNNIVKYYKKKYIYFYIYLNMQFIPVMEKLHFQQPWLQSSVISSIINVDFFVVVRIPLINRMFKGTAFFLLHFCNNVKIYFDQFNASLLKKLTDLKLWKW